MKWSEKSLGKVEKFGEDKEFGKMEEIESGRNGYRC